MSNSSQDLHNQWLKFKNLKLAILNICFILLLCYVMVACCCCVLLLYVVVVVVVVEVVGVVGAVSGCIARNFMRHHANLLGFIGCA